MKAHIKQFAIIIAKAHGDVIYSVNANYSKIVEELKKLRKSNPNLNASNSWIQEIIG